MKYPDNQEIIKAKDTIAETFNCVSTDMEFIINPLKARESRELHAYPLL